MFHELFYLFINLNFLWNLLNISFFNLNKNHLGTVLRNIYIGLLSDIVSLQVFTLKIQKNIK